MNTREIPGDRWTLFWRDDDTLGANPIGPTFGGGGVVVIREQPSNQEEKTMTTSDGYPFPIPTWTPDQGDPPLDDKAALDYLAEVLGDQASSAGYVYEAAALTVLRTGRKIVPVTGD